VGLVATLEPSPTGRRAWCHGTCGDTKALPYREVGLELWDTWLHRSSPLLGGGPSAMGHMVMPEPSCTERRVWNRGTHGDTGALPPREAARCHGTRGDAEALPCRVRDLIPWDLT
jgi:hypothetical protein